MAPQLETVSRASILARLAQVTESDPSRLGGVRVFRGTRVPVRSLFDHLRAGDSLETFLDDFPGVTRQQAEEVIALAAEDLLLAESAVA